MDEKSEFLRDKEAAEAVLSQFAEKYGLKKIEVSIAGKWLPQVEGAPQKSVADATISGSF